jgi:hypothetical protein
MNATAPIPFRAVALRRRGFDPAAVAAACGMTLAQAEAIPTGAKPIGTRQLGDRASSTFDRMLVTLRRSRRDYVMAPVSLPIVRGVWPTDETNLTRVRPVCAAAFGRRLSRLGA